MKFAVYGFYFERAFSFNDIHFMPIELQLSFWEKVNRVKDQYNYNLSGFIETSNADSENFIFSMQAVLTFVQQQDVIIKRITSEKIENFYQSDFQRRGSAAPFVMFPDLYEEIVKNLYLKLIDDNDLCNQKESNSVFSGLNNCEFKSLVYKVTEPFHMRQNFIEITYYLYFSGLEAFCKKYLNSYFPELPSEKAPEAIGYTLEKMEINYVNVFLESTTYNIKNNQLSNNDFLKLSITTYTGLRNSLFHSNKFVSDVENSPIEICKNKYPKQEVKITDFEYNLLRLCNAVILKYINIENERLDCSKWYTRFPMIKSLSEKDSQNVGDK